MLHALWFFHDSRPTVLWCRHTNIANVVVQLANEPLKEPQIIITTLTTSTAIITTTAAATRGRSRTAPPLPRTVGATQHAAGSVQGREQGPKQGSLTKLKLRVRPLMTGGFFSFSFFFLIMTRAASSSR